MYVPGYGYGRVEDRGGAIKGQRLDVFFKKHRQAEQWGRATADVYVWLPGGTTQTIARSAN
jgi:3D (Asp-Asp-Asp) domain-containing protein